MSVVRAGTDVVEHEVRVAAPPEVVFAYFTDPGRFVRWMGTEATLDPRPGGICRLRINGVTMLGEFVEVVPPTRVVLRWGFEEERLRLPPASTLVEVDLVAEADGTVVRLTHSRLPEETAGFHRDGWAHFMPRLATSAAAGPRGELPVLWHLKVSNYNEKARWALDFKAVPHVRRAIDAGFHRKVARRLSGGSTFPVLTLAGEAIGDSAEIIEALERGWPQPPLIPADPALRRRALELERFFDEELGPYTRRLVLHHLLPDANLFGHTFAPDMARVPRLFARAVYPATRRMVRRQFVLDELGVAEAFHKLRLAGERFRAELEPSGYLVGDRFTVADLTLASLVAPAVAPEQFPYPQPQRGHPLLEPVVDALEQSGIAAWTRTTYARHRGTSAEVPSPA